MNLQPCDIAAFYTASQIQSIITSITSSIDNARESMRDTFGDTQATQTVQRQSLKMLYDELAIYIKAYNLLSDADCSYTQLIAAKYNPAVSRI